MKNIFNSKINYFFFLPIPFRIFLTRYIRSLTSRFRTLPDFLLIGAPQCGTTSLYNYIINHPYIAPSFLKGVQFFDRNFTRNLNKYKAFFPPLFFKRIFKYIYNIDLITGEGSPDYLYHPYVAKRVFQYLPKIKILILLRNPVDRAYSHYQRLVRFGIVNLSFMKAIERAVVIAEKEKKKLKNNPYYNPSKYLRYSILEKGIYVDQIQNWFKYFPKKQILTIESEQFFFNPSKTMEEVFRFLNVPPLKAENYKKYNVGNYSKIDTEIRDYLLEYYKPHNRRLYDLLERRFNWDK
ncbi:MAG: sulfotransferase domain-containing protein [Promethearchaeota archaeon]